MKIKVNKHWWQFWLPHCLDVDAEYLHFHKEDVQGDYSVKVNTDANIPIGDGESIEADEAEPWYGGDAIEAEDGGVVTAEPPIVYASRGNAKMAERMEINKQ